MSRRPSAIATPSALVAGLLAICAMCGACSLGTSTTTAPAIGDSCLVGTWILTLERNQSGYSLNGTPVAVSGLAGAKVTFTSAGEEKESLGGSKPLVGVAPDGTTLSITIGGSFDFKIHASGGKYRESGSASQLPTSATVDGRSVPYQSSYTPGSGTYACSRSTLTMTTAGSVQTDQWSKG